MVRRLSGMVLLLVLCFSVGIGSIAAQDQAEDETLAYVMQAIENMTELDTVRTAVEQTIYQSFDAQGTTVNMSISQIIDGAYDNSGEDVRFSVSNAQTMDTEVGGQSQVLEMTMDMIAVADTLWVRVHDTNPSSLGALFPSEWTNATEDPTQIPGFEMLALDQLLQLTNTWQAYPLNDETIESIEELERDELDGIEMRVFAVTYSSEGLLKTGLAEQIGQAFNAEAMGVDMEGMMQQLIEGAMLDMTVWIGVKDNLLYRSEVHMVVDATIEDVFPGISTMDIQQDLNARYDYYSFNEPVEITAPDTDA
jgi:hypothetical protein